MWWIWVNIINLVFIINPSIINLNIESIRISSTSKQQSEYNQFGLSSTSNHQPEYIINLVYHQTPQHSSQHHHRSYSYHRHLLHVAKRWTEQVKVKVNVKPKNTKTTYLRFECQSNANWTPIDHSIRGTLELNWIKKLVKTKGVFVVVIHHLPLFVLVVVQMYRSLYTYAATPETNSITKSVNFCLSHTYSIVILCMDRDAQPSSSA